jgi:hypothetical protein
VVPFLRELLREPTIEGKDEILTFLTRLALGNSYLDVHGPLFREMGVPKEPDFDEQLRAELAWVKAAQEAVVAGIPDYLNLLTSDDPTIRVCSAYALATCRERSGEIAPRLCSRIEAEDDELAKASMLLCLGLVGDQGHVAFLEGMIAEEDLTLPEGGPDLARPRSGLLVRSSAARALVWLMGERAPEAAVRTLLGTLADPGPIREAYRQLPWSDSDVVGDTGLTLALLGQRVADRALPLLAGSLDSVDGLSALNVVQALLVLAFPERGAQVNPEDLTREQRLVLTAIVKSKMAWTYGKITFILKSFGLPTQREKLRELLS